MGFGLLFYGFLMTFDIMVRTQAMAEVGIDIFPDLAGYLLMLAAANRLDGYARGFSLFKKALYPLIAVGALTLLVGYASIFGEMLFLLETLTRYLKLATLLFQGVAFFFLFAGIISLASEVELPGIASRARFVAATGVVYYSFQTILTVTALLPLPISSQTLSPFMTASMLIGMFFLIFGEVVLFNCYRYICYEGEEQLKPGDAVNPLANALNKLFGKNK